MQLGAHPVRTPAVKGERKPADSESIRPPSPMRCSIERESAPIVTPTIKRTETRTKFSLEMKNEFGFRRQEGDEDADGKKEVSEEDQNYYQQNDQHNRPKAKHKCSYEQRKGLAADSLSPVSKLVMRLLLFITLLSGGVGCVVVYQVRFIATKSGRTDYALAGESVELSCHHMMKDEAEDIKQLVWSKDGKNFLRWRKNRPGLEVLSYTYKGHIDPTSVHSRLIIHNATIDMHGKYKCTVKTDLGTHEGEHDLVVISHGQCRLNDWRITSEQLRCRELFRLDCRQMFPRPVPSCGLWNDKLDKFIRSVTVDISEELPAGQIASGINTGATGASPAASGSGSGGNNRLAQMAPQQTYRVKYVDKFELTLPNGSVNPLHADLLQYAGHLIFKCDILVPDTSWRLSLRHKMFDFADGCNSDPLETIERMRANFSQLARIRLHKQHYQQHQRPLDDMEMLTSNLRYELLPPPQTPVRGLVDKIGKTDETNAAEASYQMLAANSGTTRLSNSSKSSSKSQQQQQQQQMPKPSGNLNCWQRPRVGSIAKLSCVPPPQSNSQKGQIKMSGTNLLQCRPNGHWTPINPRSVSSSIVVSNEVVDSRRTKAVLNKKANGNGTSIGSHRSARRLQDANVPANESVSLTTSPQVATNALTNHVDSAGDDDDDDSSPLPHSSPGSDANRPMELEVGLRLPSSGSARPVGSDVSTRDDISRDDERQNVIENGGESMDLTPGELASLLPSCVLMNTNSQHQSGRRSGNQRHHLASSSANDRLPLLDDEGALLESSYPTTNRHRQLKSAHRGTTNDDEWRWYSFFSSSGAHSSNLKLNQRSHYISLIIVLFTTTAMLMHVIRI